MPCIGPLHRPRGGPKPDFNFAYLSHPPTATQQGSLVLYLKGVTYRDMESVLNFMYHGEVNVAQDDLNSFLAVAEELRVKGNLSVAIDY